MSHRESYVAGTPCWMQLAAADPRGAAKFYGELMGWELANDEGDKAQWTFGGRYTAGFWKSPQPGVSYWETYVSTDDVEVTTKKVEAAGGKVLQPPLDLGGSGRIAAYLDPEGAAICAWQPQYHVGAGVVNEVGAWSWSELNNRDAASAKEFYPQVFGWQADGGDAYTEWKLGGRSIAGMRQIGDDVPAQVPPHWLVYFAVADVEKSAEAVKAAGGSQISPFVPTPAGKIAVFADPWGASFALISGLTER